MKTVIKMLCIILMLCFLLIPACSLASSSIQGFTFEQLVDNGISEEFLCTAATKDTFFALTDTSILSWQKDQDLPTNYCLLPPVSLPNTLEEYQHLSDAEKEVINQTITHIITGNDELWGINSYCGGVCKIDELGIHWLEAQFNINWSDDPTDCFPSKLTINGFSRDQMLYLSFDRKSIDVWDTLSATQTHNILPFERFFIFQAYANDQAILSAVSESNNTPYDEKLYILSLEDFSISPFPIALPVFEMNSENDTIFMSCMCYNEEDDTLYFLARGEMAEDGMLCRSVAGGNFEKVGIIHEFPYISYALSDGLYVTYRNNTLRAYDAPSFLENGHVVLQMKGQFADDDILLQYSIDHPEVSIVNHITRLEQADINDLFAHSSNIDIFAIEANQFYQTMINKGYACDLSNSENISSSVMTMYPAISQTISSENGAIWAYPVDLLPTNWLICSIDQWKNIWGDHPYPQIYEELFELMDDWERDYANLYSNTNVYGPGQLPDLMYAMITQYIVDYETEDGNISFDTPVFRYTINALENLLKSMNQNRFENNGRWDNVESDYLIQGEGAYNYFLLFNVDNGDIHNLMPLHFENEQNSVRLEMVVMVVSALSEHQEEAIAFLDYLAQEKNSEIAFWYALHENCDQPVLNEDYMQNMMSLQIQLDETEKQLTETEPAYFDSLLDKRDTIQTEINSWEMKKYLISAEGIQQYKTWASHFRVPCQSIYLSFNDMQNAFYQSVINDCRRFVNGNLSQDQLIQSLDVLCQMIREERK